MKHAVFHFVEVVISSVNMNKQLLVLLGDQRGSLLVLLYHKVVPKLYGDFQVFLGDLLELISVARKLVRPLAPPRRLTHSFRAHRGNIRRHRPDKGLFWLERNSERAVHKRLPSVGFQFNLVMVFNFVTKLKFAIVVFAVDEVLYFFTIRLRLHNKKALHLVHHFGKQRLNTLFV